LFYTRQTITNTKKHNKMARKKEEDSVSSKVSLLKVNESVEFVYAKASIAVMVSLLKNNPENKDKKFKIEHIKNETTNKTLVTRVK